MKNTIKNAADSTESFIHSKRKKWLSKFTWSKIKDRKQAKQKLLTAKTTQTMGLNRLSYTLLDTDVEGSARKDKFTFINISAPEAKSATTKYDVI
jgi:hypothetical protein